MYIHSWNIELDGKSKEEMLLLLRENKVDLNAYAVMLFLNEKYMSSQTFGHFTVVAVRADSLGFTEGALYKDIVHAVHAVGLELCPMELAPYLRLQFLEQPEGSLITVASNKPVQSDTFPNGFYLSRSTESIWLRGYLSTEDWMWSPESIFAFVQK